MTPWLLFGGAGSGTGALILQLALEQQRPVVALVRNTQKIAALQQRGVQVVQGDACDEQSVERACVLAGAEAMIISTLGGGQEYHVHRTVIDTAERCGLRQMIMVTSLGCGDGWSSLSARAKAAFGQSVRQKTLAEVWLQTSRLEYVIVRPGGLLNGEATGLAQLYEMPVHGMINRADVAEVVSRLAQKEVLGNRVYTLVQQGL